jgi:aerobic-type carbon monoxide dehydrogenase small subunit (CoxS/CutS family)
MSAAAIQHHVDVTLVVNGEPVSRRVEPRQHLIDFLRLDLGLTGSHAGCEHGVCGACTVRVNGMIVRGCLVLAAQLEGAVVETIEGLSDTGAIRDLQDAFVAHNAAQCGFCTPGMLMAASDILAHQPDADRAAIREHLSGNYCRCTGYQAIVDAVETTLAKRRKALS